jgi:hypothetical protein
MNKLSLPFSLFLCKIGRLRAQLVSARAQHSDLGLQVFCAFCSTPLSPSQLRQFKVDAKAREFDRLQAENNEIFDQFRAQTMESQSAQEALEHLNGQQQRVCLFGRPA